ncbi:MAG TPA: AAA family ATPase [Candidatus Krumholzibacteria bacterium]|nr:AAA family ATPase [Candidatus Krumholzibacteria bacterium]HPD71199.1 AAA family ATPase [Candidatus Krumholzibacteria bacterium]HRY39101.1 AAA family ATPase [Candidatus Krumholzibacteria bacterium]
MQENTLDQGQAAAVAARLQAVLDEAGRVIVGQQDMLEGLLLGLVADGHILLEGVPGLAKTLAVRTLAQTVAAGFQRIQFTPDLLPADIVGTTIYRRETGDFTVKKGPVFNSIILADEINRAPAKVQSALLEAMQERQVTIGEETFPLPDPFLVLATQNPIEQEGTYPLPEAQVDRFLLKLRVDYPDKAEERQILDRMGAGLPPAARPVVTPADIGEFRRTAEAVFVDEKIKTYILDLVFATRRPRDFGLDLEPLIAYGASPRATLALVRLARARALLRGRAFVVPEDVKAVGHGALRHRLILSYEAEARELDSDDLVTTLFENIDVP